jgi:hypothetical protein
MNAGRISCLPWVDIRSNLWAAGYKIVPRRIFLILGRWLQLTQCLKWRTPVKTMARPCSSAALITS